jgi:hypothetical protein
MESLQAFDKLPDGFLLALQNSPNAARHHSESSLDRNRNTQDIKPESDLTRGGASRLGRDGNDRVDLGCRQARAVQRKRAALENRSRAP